MECGSCNYWKKSEALSPGGDIVGECRRFPRMPFLVNKITSIASEWVYPLQYSNDSCGEHRSTGALTKIK
jgi:hypothetical protein